MADKFKVMVGKQVVFSSDDRELCDAMVSQKKLDLVHRGCDIRNEEHSVKLIEEKFAKA